MNLFSWFGAFVKTTEAEVLALITEAAAGIQVLEKDVVSAMAWLASHAGAITADVQMVEEAIIGSGLILTPTVTAAIAAANASVAALNAYAKSIKSGKATILAVVDGYVAAKQAQSAVAHAALAVAQAK